MKTHNSLFLAWQSPETRDWHVVGQLNERENDYVFKYTKGAMKVKNFIPFSGMEDISSTYSSKELFPLFKNRVLSARRPEYPQFMKWLGLDKNEFSAMEMLARTGGARATDNLQVFKRIEIQEDGTFDYYFFAHGISYLSESAKERINNLKDGEKLYLCPDPQNEYDECAVMIRTGGPVEIIGYCPRYIAKVIGIFLASSGSKLSLKVESMQANAPVNYRLMCKLEAQVDKKAVEKYLEQDEFQLIN
ncbi:TPA: HIRAN domain-containing protein [Serratia liquefaciens]|nr:HIRAN domain-containing protein [Serratia liquefaciens]